LTHIIVLNIKGKHNFKHFYYIYIVEIPTQNEEHSWICIELKLTKFNVVNHKADENEW